MKMMRLMRRRKPLCLFSIMALAAQMAPAFSQQPVMTFGEMRQGGEAAGFEKALAPRDFAFPADHGAHPQYLNEWWYFTGNLESAQGDRFGFQFTVFRHAVAKAKPALPSDWAADQVYFAHIAVTDARNGRFYVDEKFSRNALDLAGAQASPFRVWVEDWSAEGEPGDCGGCLDLVIDAKTKEFSISLAIASDKPAVLHGERGLSRKGPSADQASYYYSLTRLSTSGALEIAGESISVTGESWMDHEWFTSALADADVGWDWFSIQLDDGREIMFFQVRREEGDGHFQDGTYVRADGSYERLARGRADLSALDYWESPESGAVYPVNWRLDIPERDLSVVVDAVLDAQERAGVFRYWEGAVSITGSESGKPIGGRGYLEMTGY